MSARRGPARPRSKGRRAPPRRAARPASGRSTTKAAKTAKKARAPRPPAAPPARRVERRPAVAPRSRTAAAPQNGRETGKYVYCIIDSAGPLSIGPVGIGEDSPEVFTIDWGPLSAVVSDSPLEILDPTRENVLSHQRVNEMAMRDRTVLPMSFGTVFKTHDDVVEFLKSAGDAFVDVLQKMENKLEFGLKVVWDRDAVLHEIEQEDEDISRLKAELASRKGSTYFARMQYGRMVDAALQAKSERYVSDIFGALRGASVAARANKPIGDRMILNAAFLVDRSDEDAFDRGVKALGARYDKLTFKYTGPWPPYNFVNIRLKLERA